MKREKTPLHRFLSFLPSLSRRPPGEDGQGWGRKRKRKKKKRNDSPAPLPLLCALAARIYRDKTGGVKRKEKERKEGKKKRIVPFFG